MLKKQCEKICNLFAIGANIIECTNVVMTQTKINEKKHILMYG